jgi:hypothetical protein
MLGLPIRRPRIFRRVALPATLLLALPGASASSSVAPPSPAYASSLGCHSAPGQPQDIAVWIYVRKWCGNPAVRGQLQIKVQVRVTNEGRRPLDISRKHFVLIVTSLNRSKWSPPRIGHAPTEVPFKTTYKGHHVWAIPANYDRAYDQLPQDPDYGTFATHWGGTTLRPGATFWPIDHQRGALVFYRPIIKHQQELRDGVLGVAYVNGRHIVVMCNEWGPQVRETTW